MRAYYLGRSATMTSIRNIAFLVLTAGLGIGAYLMINGPLLRGGAAEEERLPVTVEMTAESTGLPQARDAADTDGPDTLVDVTQPGRGDLGGGSDGSPVASTVIWPLTVDLTLTLDGSVDVPEGAQRLNWGAKAGVKGSVLGARRRGIAATVLFLYGPNEGRSLQTDGRGRFGATNLLPGISIVRVTTADGRSVEREVRLMSRTTLDFHVSFAGATTLEGTAKDERGVPIDGAEVRVDGRPTFTNAEGIFVISGVPPGTAQVSVRKEGFAHCTQKVGVGYSDVVIAKNFVIFMKKGAQLQITVNRSVGAAEPSLAYLMPAAGPGRSSDGRSFPWHEINPISIPPGGTAVVDGLPLDSVNVGLFHRGAVPSPASRNVRIHGGRTNAVAIDLLPAPTVRGVVLDAGKPASGASVTIQASDRGHATSRSMQQKGPLIANSMVVTTSPAAYDETRTDAKGNFFFTSHPDLITTYYATATSRDGLRRGVAVIEPGAKSLSIELEPIENKVGAFEIGLPGRFQGLPVEISVNGKPAEPYMLRPGQPLLIENLPYGHWDVGARWRGQDVVMRQNVIVGDSVPMVPGSLPEGAIRGQTEDERRRVLEAAEIEAAAFAPKLR